MKIMLFALAAVSALTLAAPASARGDDPLFAAPDPIQITIKAPLSYLTRNRNAQTPVSGALVDPAGQSLPITLRLRGITRRTSEICDVPPLRVDFTAPPPATSVFAGQKKLKLVTHCRNSASFQQYVLLEYSAYRMYNLLTPRSFRVRLASIDYRDSDGRPIISRIGYFIEDLDDVAHRNGLKEVHAGERIPVSYLSSQDAGRYGLFQHMLGNHDWSMRAGPPGDDCCHNARLIGVAAPGSAVPVPYDFDFSGLVGAPYASPPSEIDIADVRQRYYRGYCMHNADVVVAARQMRAQRPQLLAVLGQVPGLDPKTQARAASYLNGFFADIGTDADVGSKVLKRCLG
jgi:hypothetical protein